MKRYPRRSKGKRQECASEIIRRPCFLCTPRLFPLLPQAMFFFDLRQRFLLAQTKLLRLPLSSVRAHVSYIYEPKQVHFIGVIMGRFTPPLPHLYGQKEGAFVRKERVRFAGLRKTLYLCIAIQELSATGSVGEWLKPAVC